MSDTPTLDDVLKGVLAIRISTELCYRLAMAEAIAHGFEWHDIKEEIAAAHEHIHNAIELATTGDRKVVEAMSDELREMRADFETFLASAKEEWSI